MWLLSEEFWIDRFIPGVVQFRVIHPESSGVRDLYRDVFVRV